MLDIEAQKQKIKKQFKLLNCCVLIPSYNNGQTIELVIQSTKEYCDDLIIVNDGSTDNTSEILNKYPELTTIIHPSNKGKGVALRNGFSKAVELGFDYVISIDSDGQHFPKDFVNFLNEIEKEPGSLIIGSRNMSVENVPSKSNFGNRVSNFWFRVETGIKLPDTQSGFRLYPVKKLKKIYLFTTRFEFEIEVIVKAAWRAIPIKSVPVSVYYAPKDERVSHFNPQRDSTRISFLNTYLVILAAFFWRPILIIRKITFANLKKVWVEEVIASHESALNKSISVGVGLFFGIVPIWGFQFALAIFSAIYFKLNKIIVGLAAQISFPPFIPFILLGSLKTGEFFLLQKVNTSLISSTLNIETVKQIGWIYFVGATYLSIIIGILGFIISWIILKIIGYKQTTHDSSN